MPKQIISVQEPAKLDDYLHGLDDGYQQGNYDAYESMYILITDHKLDGAQMLYDYLINKFEHGGHPCN